MRKRYLLGVFVTTSFLFITLFLSIQSVFAQTGNEKKYSLETLGYDDQIVNGPRSEFLYRFDIPANWEIVDGSYLDLEFSYQPGLLQDNEIPSALVQISLNFDTPLYSEVLTEPITRQLHLDLPKDQFRTSEDLRQDLIVINFDSAIECGQFLQGSLLIKNNSIINIAHIEKPLEMDLSQLPRPIYQQNTVEPTHVRLALSDNFDEIDVQASSIVAARFGQLTSNRLPISATLASNLSMTDIVPNEHLVVIGQPDTNPIIERLELPIGLAERQLTLSSQMPVTVTPGAMVTYTLHVTNSSDASQELAIEDVFSPNARFMECGEECEQIASREIRWDVGELESGESASTTVTLEVNEVISATLPVRHTATLLNEDEVLNVDTLTSQIGEAISTELHTSSEIKSATFFINKDRGVAEDAGIIQELISPWNQNQIIIVVAGLNDEALLKAAQGLNPNNQFPGIKGESAVIEDVHPIDHSEVQSERIISFESLGYTDRELSVLNLEPARYEFQLPPGLVLDTNSYLSLNFAHAEILSTVGASIKISLNGTSIGSAVLDENNIDDAWLQTPLGNRATQHGTNLVLLEPTTTTADPCLTDRNDGYWLTIYEDSFFHLNTKPAQIRFDLKEFPYPFNEPGDLANVVFSLPDSPRLGEIEGLMRVSSLLGSSSESEQFWPKVIFGQEPDPEFLSNRHVLALGLPAENAFIRRVNNRLPQPFFLGSNDIDQQIDVPIYDIDDADLGYIQQLASPWNEQQSYVFVAVTGTTNKGVDKALSGLAEANNLQGNLVVIRDEEDKASTDTRPDNIQSVLSTTLTSPSSPPPEPTESVIIADEVQATSTAPVLIATPSTSNDTSTFTGVSGPRWVLPLFIISFIGVIISIVLWVRKGIL